jgi:hypothetical protein
MGELDNRVSITVEIADTSATRAGFGIMAIVHEHELGTSRVLTYNDLDGLKADFPSYTPVGRYGEIFFSQAFKAQTIKVIEVESGDTYTQALDAAALFDNDWYAIGTPSHDQANQELTAAYALANKKIALNVIDDIVAIDTGTTDLGSVLQALTNNRAATYYSGLAGEELTISDISVVGTVATVTHTAASIALLTGQKVGVWGSVLNTDLNSSWTISAVNSTVEFEFTVPTGTDTTSATDANGWAKMNLVDSAISGKMLPQDAGSRTWDLQQLSAVTADNLSATAQTNLGGKNINWFTNVAGLNVTGGLKAGGGGGKLASGRYIDIQRGADWLESNLQIDLFELMVREGGDLGYDALGFQKIESVISIRLNDGLDKGFLTPFVSGQYSGNNWVIVMPKLASIPQADKTARLLQGIEIFANIRGKIHNMEAAITLST